jgi:hypothetical protein
MRNSPAEAVAAWEDRTESNFRAREQAERTWPTRGDVRLPLYRGGSAGYLSVRPVTNGIASGNGVTALYFATLATGADEAVTDTPERSDAQLGVVVAEPDGDDAGRVEHPTILYPSDYIDLTDGSRWHMPSWLESLTLLPGFPLTRAALDSTVTRQSRLSRWQRLP